jgi:hypothetical protein
MFHKEVNLTIAAAEDNQLMIFQPAHELIFPWVKIPGKLKAVMDSLEE